MASILRKFVLVGDSGCGKSSIVQRYVDEAFSESFISTIGVDFQLKTVEIRGKEVKFQIWDTAGQERFRTITTAYYRGAHAIIIVFDVTDAQAFGNVQNWINEVREHVDGSSNALLLLVGNKTDCARHVTHEAAQQLAQANQMSYMEVSAKSGFNIDNMFSQLGHTLVEEKETMVPQSCAPEHEEAAAEVAADYPEEQQRPASVKESEEAPEVEEVQEAEPRRMKAIIVGDSGVGKTNVLHRLVGDEFQKEECSTIGVDFASTTVTVQQEQVKVQIWDAAGQERFRTIVASYYRGAQAVVVAFDLTSVESFQNAKYWLDSTRNANDTVRKWLLVGTKVDLVDSRRVDYATAKAFADQHRLAYFEVSAKDDRCIDELRRSIAEAAFDLPAAPPGAAKASESEQQAAGPAPKSGAQTLLKVVIVGDSGVGKSNILCRFAFDKFSEVHSPTIGVDFAIRSLTTPTTPPTPTTPATPTKKRSEKQVKLQVWDTAGQERFRTITSAYYRGASVIVVVFDVTFVDSFNNVQKWLRELAQFTSEQTPVFLVGNKTDLAESRRVDYETARQLADRHNLVYFEVSAKDGSQVQQLFEAVAQATRRGEGAGTRQQKPDSRGGSSASTGRSSARASNRSGTKSDSGSKKSGHGSASASASASASGSASRSSSRWIDSRKLHDSLVKSETPETGLILRRCEALLDVERTFVKDLGDMIDEERAFAQRKREVLNAKWNDRVYEPIKQKLVERQRADAHAAAIRRKLASYERFLGHATRRDKSFLNDFDNAEYDPFKWQREDAAHSKPVRLTGVDPCLLFLHNQREETRLIGKFDRAATQFAKNDETGRFEFYNELPQLALASRSATAAGRKPRAGARRSLQVTSAPAAFDRGRTDVSASTSVGSSAPVAFGTHYMDEQKAKRQAGHWSNMAYFDVDSLSKHSTSDAVLLSRNKSHFELTWSNENDQALVDSEMNLPKRRAFPDLAKQKTAAEFLQAHFKLDPVAERATRQFDDRVVDEEPLQDRLPLVTAE